MSVFPCSLRLSNIPVFVYITFVYSSCREHLGWWKIIHYFWNAVYTREIKAVCCGVRWTGLESLLALLWLCDFGLYSVTHLYNRNNNIALVTSHTSSNITVSAQGGVQVESLGQTWGTHSSCGHSGLLRDTQRRFGVRQHPNYALGACVTWGNFLEVSDPPFLVCHKNPLQDKVLRLNESIFACLWLAWYQ